MILFLLLFWMIIGLYKVKLNKDFFHPLIVYIFPFLIQYIAYLVLYAGNSSVSDKTLLIYAVSIVLYCFGISIGESFFSRCLKVNQSNEIYIYNGSILFYTLVTFIGVLAILFDIFRHASFSSPAALYQSMRLFINYSDGYSFISKYVPVLYYVIFGCYLYNNSDIIHKPNEHKKFVFRTAILAFFAVISFARTEIIMVLCVFTYCLLYKKRDKIFNNKQLMKNVIKILTGVFIIVLFFVWIAKATNKSGSDLISSQDYFLWKYLGYPIVTLDKYCTENPGVSSGYFILGTVGKILGNAGVIDMGFIHLMPRAGTFNVFSYIGPIYLDVGNWYILIQFLLGFFVAYLYVQNNYKGGRWTVFYSFYLYAIVMSFYGFQYTLTQFVYVVLCFGIINFINKIRIGSK